MFKNANQTSKKLFARNRIEINFHFLEETQFLIVCWKQWVLYCITLVLAYHICVFWIDACAQNSTNVTYVSVSKKDKKRTYYKCLGRLHNQNFEIKKCQHYCLHTIIVKNPLNGWTFSVINTGFQDFHMKDDFWSSDDHLVSIYCFMTSKKAAAWIADFVTSCHFCAWKQDCSSPLGPHGVFELQTKFESLCRVEALILSFNR